MSRCHIRPEAAADYEQLDALIIAAFADAPYSDHNEHLILRALRQRDELTLALVATAKETPNHILGQAAFSPVSLSSGDTDWYGLGPLAVAPEHQHHGIGSALIHHGLAELRKLGAKGCVVLGEPDYYQRFGFKADQHLSLAGVPADYFLSLRYTDSAAPIAEVSYSPAFYLEQSEWQPS